MNVGDLRKITEGLDDDIEVLVPGYDHSYDSPSAATYATVAINTKGEYYEWWGEDMVSEGEEPKMALVIV